MKILMSWPRRRSIIKYRRKLPTALAKDYGKSDFYSPAQVKATVERNRLNQSYLVYALAMFCTAEAYDSYCKEHGLDTDFESAKAVIGESLRNQTFGFNTGDLSGSSSSVGTDGYYSGSAGDGGCGGE